MTFFVGTSASGFLQRIIAFQIVMFFGVVFAFVFTRSVRYQMSLQVTPLDFVFRGYSIWLELEQTDGDLDAALKAAAHDLDVDCIPAPHVTVVYGISHLSENQILELFQEKLIPRVQSWPELHVKGFKVDKSFDGVDGQEMVRI